MTGQARGRRGRAEKRWQPPEGLTPEEVRAVIAAAQTERDRLLLRVLWATGGRVSEVLALRAQDVRRDALVLPNLKNPSPAGQDGVPLRGRPGPPRRAAAVAEGRGPGRRGAAVRLPQAGRGRAACGPSGGSRPGGSSRTRRERAQVRVLALRESKAGQAGAPAPVHPHLLRHARVRQIVRQTKSLPLAQKQAGWSRLQMAYLTLGRRRGPGADAPGGGVIRRSAAANGLRRCR